MRKRINKFLLFFVENKDALPPIDNVTNYLTNNKVFRKFVFSFHDFHQFSIRKLKFLIIRMKVNIKKNKNNKEDKYGKDTNENNRETQEENTNNKL